jgi:uncharacterized membrane protein YqhA
MIKIMKPQNIFGLLLKVLSFFAVLGILALSIGIIGYAVYEIIGVLQTILKNYTTADDNKIVISVLKSVDLVLLSVVLFIMGVGLFELFIKPIDNLPKWLIIKDIDDLKSMLIKVIIVVIGVSFTGKIVTWDGITDLFGYGVGLGAVIFALSFFLRVKSEEKES